LDFVFDGYSLALEGDKLRARLAEMFRLELTPDLDDGEAEGTCGMIDVEGPDQKPPTNGHVLQVLNAVYVSRRWVALDVCPDIHEFLDGLGEVAVDDHTPGSVTDKVALRKIVCDAGGMVHVAMREAHIIDGDDLARCPSNVKANVVLGGGNHGFLPAEGETEDVRAGDFLSEQPSHDRYIRDKRASRPAGGVK
jgi:hypothetical protein